MGGGARVPQPLCSRRRACQADNLMAEGEQFGDEGRTDKPCGSCDEDLHISFLSLEWDKT